MYETVHAHMILFINIKFTASGRSVFFLRQTVIEQENMVLQTESKRTIALRESEDRYRALFHLSPVAVYSCDAAGVIQDFNQCAAELWGRSPTPGDTDERFCGSFKLFLPDGTFMPHAECPMAQVVNGKISEVTNAEVVIER